MDSELDQCSACPELSIIVVNWNTREFLARCLESIYTHPPSYDFEVLVVDNGSSDGSCEMMWQAFPMVCLISNDHNAGFAGANNQAMRLANGKYVLLLNSDAEVLPHTLDTLLRCAELNTDAGIIGAKLLNTDRSFQAGGAEFPTLWSEIALLTGAARWLYGRSFPSYPADRCAVTTPCDWVGGACLLARRTAIQSVGLLDESYFMYCEEMDWCYRMRQAGWAVVLCADAQVLHAGGASARRTTADQLKRLYGSKARFFARHRGQAVSFVFRLLVRVVALSQALRWSVLAVPGNRDARDRATAYFGLASAVAG